MREIKFRAWDKIKNVMDYEMSYAGNISKDMNNAPGIGEGENFSELMQYTGLKDKNGKEIYEGDILKNGDYVEDAHAYNEWIREVKWDNDTAMFIGIDGERYEIIGNIYETPELITQPA